MVDRSELLKEAKEKYKSYDTNDFVVSLSLTAMAIDATGNGGF